MSNTKPMTITEKIFALHSSKEYVQAGELIEANVDITLANDITGPIAIEEFKETGKEQVFVLETYQAQLSCKQTFVSFVPADKSGQYGIFFLTPSVILAPIHLLFRVQSLF